MGTLDACPRPSLMACGTSFPSGTLNSTDLKDLVIWHVKIEQAVSTGLPACLKILWSGEQDKVYNPGTRKGWHFTFQQDWWFHQSPEWTWTGIGKPSLHSQFLVPSTCLRFCNSTFGVPFFWGKQCHLLLRFQRRERAVGSNHSLTLRNHGCGSSCWQLHPGCQNQPQFGNSSQYVSPLSLTREIYGFITGSLSLFFTNCSVPNLFNSGSSISSERV